MMMNERKQSLITNAPVVNGEFVNLSDRLYYEKLLADVREQNRANRADGISTVCYLAKRYRGSRKSQPRKNAQSMCWAKNGTSVSVYFYERNKY